MPKIELTGYLSKSRLDKEGAKHIEFEFSAQQSVEIAKLELMSRDLEEHLPVLLKVTVKGMNGNKNQHKRIKKFTV